MMMSSDVLPGAALLHVTNHTPLHTQLLLQLGTCSHDPKLMEEGEKIQQILLNVDPVEREKKRKSTGVVAKKKKKEGDATSTESMTVPSSSSSASSDEDELWSAKSIAALKEATSDPYSYVTLAILYDVCSPHASLRDLKQSVYYYGLAAIKGNIAFACARLAHFFITGEKMVEKKATKPKHTSKIAELRAKKLAAATTAPAEAEAEKDTVTTFVLERDVLKAQKWLRLGAEKGHTLCMYQLAFMLDEGVATQKRDVQAAIPWYVKAANAGYGPAAHCLGLLYLDGVIECNLEADVTKALTCFKQASDCGDVTAQLKLGQLYFMGDSAATQQRNRRANNSNSNKGQLEEALTASPPSYGIDTDINSAIRYLTLAAENPTDPSTDAAKILGIIYTTRDNNQYDNDQYQPLKGIHYLNLSIKLAKKDLNSPKNELSEEEKKALLFSVKNVETILDRAIKRKKYEDKLKGIESEITDKVIVEAMTSADKLVEPPPLASSSSSSSSSSSTAAASSSSSSSSSSTTTPGANGSPSVEQLTSALHSLHISHPDYGAPRLHAALHALYPDWKVSQDRIKKIMKQNEWTPVQSNENTSNSVNLQ